MTKNIIACSCSVGGGVCRCSCSTSGSGGGNDDNLLIQSLENGMGLSQFLTTSHASLYTAYDAFPEPHEHDITAGIAHAYYRHRLAVKKKKKLKKNGSSSGGSGTTGSNNVKNTKVKFIKPPPPPPTVPTRSGTRMQLRTTKSWTDKLVYNGKTDVLGVGITKGGGSGSGGGSGKKKNSSGKKLKKK